MMKTVDVFGVGIGPFNLSLAALLDKKPVRALFVDQQSEFSWHAGIMMDWTTLQVPFLADLVTMAAPTSPYTFLNYLHEHERLYPFFYKEDFLIPRAEYNNYCQWVAKQLGSCQFATRVERIDYEPMHGEDYWLIQLLLDSGERQKVRAKNVVLGTGSVPYLPSCLHELKKQGCQKVHHSAEYLSAKSSALQDDTILVLGSGQSAAEVVQDLLETKSERTRVHWLTMEAGFFPMEYSKLGLEHFSPDYVDYFHKLPMATKDDVLPKQDLLYKGISAKTISDIYTLLYREHYSPECAKTQLLALSRLYGVHQNNNGTLTCTFEHIQQQCPFELTVDRVIAGTGYHRPRPDFIEPLVDIIQWDEQGRYQVSRDYQIETKVLSKSCRLFSQNAELHTHGIGAPDLTLGAYRSATIANQLLGKPHFKTYKKNTFLQFGVEN